MGWPKGVPRGGKGRFQKGEAPPEALETTDPSAIPPIEGSAGEDDTAPKRSHKRRAGGGKSEAKLDLNGVEALLMSIHFSLAALTKTPELQLDQTEAANLAKAAGNVARHYDIPELPAKMIDWTNLLICVGAVYGPRVMAISSRVKANKNGGQVSTSEPDPTPNY